MCLYACDWQHNWLIYIKYATRLQCRSTSLYRWLLLLNAGALTDAPVPLSTQVSSGVFFSLFRRNRLCIVSGAGKRGALWSPALPPGARRGWRGAGRGGGARARGLRGRGGCAGRGQRRWPWGCGAARAPRGVYTGSRSRPSCAVLNGFLVARQGEKMDDHRPFFVDYYIKGSAFGSSKLNAARPI